MEHFFQVNTQNKPGIHSVAYILWKLHISAHTQTGGGARGSAATFPGSLTVLMEALCLKLGQTTEDSGGDAYQLLATARRREEGRERTTTQDAE